MTKIFTNGNLDVDYKDGFTSSEIAPANLVVLNISQDTAFCGSNVFTAFVNFFTTFFFFLQFFFSFVSFFTIFANTLSYYMISTVFHISPCFTDFFLGMKGKKKCFIIYPLCPLQKKNIILMATVIS